MTDAYANPLAESAILKRYKRAIQESDPEHRRVVDEAQEFYKAYGLDSIQGRDFAHLQKIWGDHPPEIGMLLSAVNDFWGQLVTSRRTPSFPGFDTSIGDEVIGKMMSLLIDAARRWAHSPDVEEQALMDLLLVGLGFGEDSLETRGRPPFRPQDRYIPLSDIRWDPNANLKGLRDGQYFIPRHHYGVEEACARFPEHEEKIRAIGQQQGASAHPGASEGAQSLGGKNTTVRLYGSDGRPIASENSRWLHEIQVDDFQFLLFESLVGYDGPDGKRKEGRAADFEKAMSLLQEEAIQTGQPFEKPEVSRYAQGTWYRVEMLVEASGGEPVMLSEPAPVPGNQPLVKALTGFPLRYRAAENDRIKTRWFAFGVALTGLQKLSSVSVRIGIEQEARRNRGGGAIEKTTFESPAEKQLFIDSMAVPGAMPDIPDGAWEKIHFNEPMGVSHVPAMQEMFKFLAVDFPAYMFGRSGMSRGTFEGDRSSKFVTQAVETGNQMLEILTASFTSFLEKGAITQARLMLEGLDAKDIDRLLGRQPLWPGITGQVDPQSGQLVPLPVLDEMDQPVLDPQTQQPLVMTIGRFLKENVGEIFDNDITFGLRPSAASQRLADQELLTQHGIIKDLLQVAPPEIIVPAYLKTFAEGTTLFQAAAELDTFYAKQRQQQEEQAQAATEQGVVQFFAQLAQTDFEKALGLMQQISQTVTGPQAGGEAQVQ